MNTRSGFWLRHFHAYLQTERILSDLFTLIAVVGFVAVLLIVLLSNRPSRRALVATTTATALLLVVVGAGYALVGAQFRSACLRADDARADSLPEYPGARATRVTVWPDYDNGDGARQSVLLTQLIPLAWNFARRIGYSLPAGTRRAQVLRFYAPGFIGWRGCRRPSNCRRPTLAVTSRLRSGSSTMRTRRSPATSSLSTAGAGRAASETWVMISVMTRRNSRRRLSIVGIIAHVVAAIGAAYIPHMARRRTLSVAQPQVRALLRSAALLMVLLMLLCAAACGGGAVSSARVPPGSPAASVSPSPLSVTNVKMQVRTVGRDSVILLSRRSVRFTFRFSGVAPSSWRWRVVGFYGDKMAAGRGETTAGSRTGSVVWNGLRANGSPADPGLYLVKLGVVGAPARSLTTVGWVRFQPPVKAHVYTRLPAAGRRVALTFDDGGGRTAWYWILRELRAGHAKGTFFPIGRYVGHYARRMARLTIRYDMAIGSHSWSHPDFRWLSGTRVRAQLRRTERVWWSDFRASPIPYLRPPYGAYNARTLSIAGRLGYSRVIMWDVDSLDWTNPGVHAIVRNVLHQVRPGSIVLLHMRGKTPKALPRIIAGLRARHYQMVTVPELFTAAGFR